MYLSWMRLQRASGSTPSTPPPVTKRISRRSFTSRMPSPLSLSAPPTPQRPNSSTAKENVSPPAMSSTATTATWASPRSRSEAHTASMRATASGERIPSGFET